MCHVLAALVWTHGCCCVPWMPLHIPSLPSMCFLSLVKWKAWPHILGGLRHHIPSISYPAGYLPSAERALPFWNMLIITIHFSYILKLLFHSIKLQWSDTWNLQNCPGCWKATCLRDHRKIYISMISRNCNYSHNVNKHIKYSL